MTAYTTKKSFLRELHQNMYISLTIDKIMAFNSAKMAKATYQMLRRVKNDKM